MNQQIRCHLHDIENLLREADLWQHQPPSEQALASSAPFAVDTLTPLQWLQWVLLPRMHALLDRQGALPENFAVAPYYEVALADDLPVRAPLLNLLNQLDAHWAAL
ncbi:MULTISPECIES: YqcC family protein [unclassified Erwinia]|uniref:YqcC family protein n=1 Tax=unclassified Erwinia TaxID=2622719 RepID=UPI001F53E02B|nr:MULTISPECIES: YqcC family protein [unclassified Erwinia]